MNVSCKAEPCPVILNSTCVYYAGANLVYTGVNTNDNLQLVIQKIDAKFKDAGLGYVFENGITQAIPGDPVKLGGILTQNTFINSDGFTFALSGTIESSSFITTGGTSSQFVKGDGSLDSTSYQPSGNYITALTGDGTASGPGLATFTLSNSGVIANTYGSNSQVPVITVDAKGRITNVTNTAISYPAALLLFSGDLTGAGLTGANVTLTLNTVNSGIFNSITPLKFSVNEKGLVTGASALTNLDIFALIGYTPVPQTRTITINGITQNLSTNRTWTIGAQWGSITGTLTAQTDLINYLSTTYTPLTRTLTINGQTYDLSANRTWNISTLPSQTGNNGKYLQTDGVTASWQTVDALPNQSGNSGKFLTTDGLIASWQTLPPSGVTSVGLSMPSAFTVTNSPVTSSGTLTVTGAGLANQYIRGDGTLANFPSTEGGGSSVSYYLNGSVNQGTFGGDVYYEMSKTPIFGAGTNFTRTNAQGNGYIASFITDAGDPSLLNIPGGNWTLEFYFNANSGGGSPQFYAEIYKVSVTDVFTLVASGSSNPEGITNGTTIDQYFTSIPVPQTTLLVTDRLAVRVYVITSGRTITLHTEDNNLCQVVTTFSTGLNALNGLTAQVQYFAIGSSGTDFNISSSVDTHTFNLPVASAINTGKLSNTDWSTFDGKQNALGFTPENVVNKENVTLDASSTKYPTNNLVKTSLDNFSDDVDYAIMTNQRILFNF